MQVINLIIEVVVTNRFHCITIKGDVCYGRPISISVTGRIYILHHVIIIKSEVLFLCHCWMLSYYYFTLIIKQLTMYSWAVRILCEIHISHWLIGLASISFGGVPFIYKFHWWGIRICKISSKMSIALDGSGCSLIASLLSCQTSYAYDIIHSTLSIYVH